MATTAVDIVISTYNRGDCIDATLASIRRNSYRNFSLWVLDQSDNDLTEQCVLRHAAEDQRINYRRAPLAGISPTRNRGVALGSAPYVIFTNDDCSVAPNWIEALLAELEGSDTWMIFGRVLPGERATGARDETVLAVKLSERREVYYHSRFNLGFGHGHNMAVRRDRFVELGGFDALLGSGGPLGSWDERDIGYRVLSRGGKIVYTPDAVVYHNHWQGWDGVKRSYKNYGIGTGASVAKYLRCGDIAAIYLLLEWLFSQGLRQTASGIFKWRRWSRVSVGLMQLVYPWVGVLRGMRYSFDRKQMLYRNN